MTHDQSRQLWALLEAEYRVRHPVQETAMDDGAMIWMGEVHDLIKAGYSFDYAWARVQRTIQEIEGRYVPPPVPPVDVGDLRVVGRALVAARDGAPFRWRGITAFRLLEQVAHGREDEARAFLRWAHDAGFSVVRVLSMASGLFRLTPQDGIEALPRLVTLVEEADLYLHLVALADTASSIAAHMDHAAYCSALMARVQVRPTARVALFEVANEPYHGTQETRLHEQAYLRQCAAMANAVNLRAVPIALGAAASDESTEMAGPGTIVAHLDRSRDPWNMVRRVRELELVSSSTGHHVINSEPDGFGEREQSTRMDGTPYHRQVNPALAFTFGVLGRIFEVSSTFHCEDGLAAVVPGPVQQSCAAAFIEGTRVVADDVRLTFVNTGWAGAPVAAFNTATCVRAYTGTRGDWGITVLLGLSGDPGVQWANGWAPGRVLAEKPGVRVLEITKS